MRKYTRPILVLSLLMILVCVAARLLMGRTYRTSFVCPPAFLSDSLPVPENDDPDTVRIENVRLEGNRLFFEAIPCGRALPLSASPAWTAGPSAASCCGWTA